MYIYIYESIHFNETYCNAAAIVDVLKLALKDINLDLNQMCGLRTDNANVIVILILFLYVFVIACN